MSPEAAWDKHLESRGLIMPASFRQLFKTSLPSGLEDIGVPVFVPMGEESETPPSAEWAEAVIDGSDWPLLPNLVPFMMVDEQSFACLVASDVDDDPLPGEGAVVRWHLGVERQEHQAGVLDTDCLLYAESVLDELEARDEGLDRILEKIGPAYEESFIDRDERPGDFVVRPIRIACQNVIVALAAFSQDSSFDGLSVVAWQTCEVPHVATHEANRALAVITLCDAFQNGGTMEIRFDHGARVRKGKETFTYKGHPEKRKVPASLRRFGRTVGVDVGAEDARAITPIEARDLFQAITPMPDGLRKRFDHAVKHLGVAPERLCYALLKPIWKDIELDYLLATSDRTPSILSGGDDWTNRLARQSESEACRAAVMVGMLYRRLNGTDAAGADGNARVLEDRRKGVEWSIDEVDGAVTFTGLEPDSPLPWADKGCLPEGGAVTVIPRSTVTDQTLDHLSELANGAAGLLMPRDLEPSREVVPESVAILTCPDRLADIDRSIEDRLLSARVSRG